MQQAKQLAKAVLLTSFLVVPLTVCGSSNKAATGTTTSTLGVTAGPADAHCQGVPPQEANICITDANVSSAAVDGNTTDSNATNSNTQDSNSSTDANTMTNDYGHTMYGAEGDDDDCKYHVNWSMSAARQTTPISFTVSATRLVENTPLTGAQARAEVFLNDTHPAPNTTPAQSVTESPPGTYTISPVVFDASGQWTVRFHFYEQCDDTQDNSEHGHAAFYVTIP